MNHQDTNELSRLQLNNELLVKWLHLTYSGKTIYNYLSKHNYNKIGVYGLNDIGVLLCDELNDKLLYAMDVKANYMNIDIEAPLYDPNDDLPESDLIIIAVVNYYKSVKEQLKNRVNCPIVSLMDIIEAAYER